MSLELLKMEGFKLIMMRDMYHNNIVASMSVYAAVTEEKAVEYLRKQRKNAHLSAVKRRRKCKRGCG